MRLSALERYLVYYYRFTNWLMFLCGQLQSPRPDVMPDRTSLTGIIENFQLIFAADHKEINIMDLIY